MNNTLIKIFCFIIFLGSSFLTISQDKKIKFGYHDQSGNIKDINTKEIFKKIEEEKKLSVISKEIADTTIPLLDSNYIIDSITSVSVIQDTILVSVLLPLYIERNYKQVKAWEENKQDTNRIHSTSDLALSFLEGIMFAVDSLSDLQIPIKLQVYNTENNLDTVRKISNIRFVKQSNVVFGPIHPKNFNFFRNKFKSDTNKIIINPLSIDDKFLKNNQNVYFLQPLLKQKRDSICSFIKKFEESRKISFVTIKSDEMKSDYNIIKYRLDSFFTEFSFKEFTNLSEIDKTSFTFLKNEGNLLFVLSENKLFINKIIKYIRSIDTNVSVYSSEKVINIEEIDIENLMKLDMRVPVSNYFDNYSKKNRNLQNKFENVYYHKMNKNSRLSFFSILHFCSDQKQYNFTQLYDGGGFVNTDVQICTYKDYRLIPIK